MANFKVGDEVVCIDAQDTYGIKAGKKYRALALRDTTPCGCQTSLIYIGDTSHTGTTNCSKCGRDYLGSWYFAYRFIKLDGLKKPEVESTNLPALVGEDLWDH